MARELANIESVCYITFFQVVEVTHRSAEWRGRPSPPWRASTVISTSFSSPGTATSPTRWGSPGILTFSGMARLRLHGDRSLARDSGMARLLLQGDRSLARRPQSSFLNCQAQGPQVFNLSSSRLQHRQNSRSQAYQTKGPRVTKLKSSGFQVQGSKVAKVPAPSSYSSWIFWDHAHSRHWPDQALINHSSPSYQPIDTTSGRIPWRRTKH